MKRLTEVLSSLLPDVDRKALLEDHAMGQNLVESGREAYKINSDGRVDDMLSFVQPWGFELSEIDVPVFLYHGSEDRNVPFGHGEWLAKHVPHEKLKTHLLQGEGHLSIFLGPMEEMLDELLVVST